MDGQRFDALARALAAGTSRRRLLRALGGSAASSLLGIIGAGGADAATCADRCNQLPAGPGRDQCLNACAAATQSTADAAAARAYAQAVRDCGGDTARVCGSGTDVTCCAQDEVCSDGGCVAGGTPCPAGQVQCASGCTDVSTDPNNCGNCELQCSTTVEHASAVCNAGQCAFACDSGYAACGSTCCPDFIVCQNGVCGCPSGQFQCASVCCPNGEKCENGTCGSCPSGQKLCQGGCAECCDAGDCASGQQCCGGKCCRGDAVCGKDGFCFCPPGGCGCPDHLIDCGNGCTDLSTDPMNCGLCGVACAIGVPHAVAACSGGHCGFVCESGYNLCGLGCCPDTHICVNGQCACPPGQGSCSLDGPCIDVLNDPTNCGSCGIRCETDVPNAHAICNNGKCDFACNTGFIPCGYSCVAPDNAPPDCKTCGRGCGSDEPYCCDGICTNLRTDPANCGACGHVCDMTAGQTCVRGICSCPQGTTDCARGCTDINTDLVNCGGCGHACSDGQICRDGHCLTPCDNFLQCPKGCGCADAFFDSQDPGRATPVCVTGAIGVGQHCSWQSPFRDCSVGEICLPNGAQPAFCAELCGA